MVRCPGCGELVDMRDLAEAIDHLHGEEIEEEPTLAVNSARTIGKQLDNGALAVPKKKPPEGAARRRRNRGALPAHLPRVEILIDLDDHAYPCCQQALHRIGEAVSERLDIVPVLIRVLVVRRPKYACRACETMVQASAPALAA